GTPARVRMVPRQVKVGAQDRAHSQETVGAQVWAHSQETVGLPTAWEVHLHDSVMLKTTGNSSKKYNLSMSNSFSALNEEDEEDVENVYDESANLIQNTKAGGSSSFTAAAG
ncbi:hypothetical protein Tco_1443595, partial [Tanacetum coccineum]